MAHITIPHMYIITYITYILFPQNSVRNNCYVAAKHHESVKYYVRRRWVGHYYIMQFFLSRLGCDVEGHGGKPQSVDCHQHASTLKNAYSPLIITDTAEPTGNTWPAIHLLLTAVWQDRWCLSSWIFVKGIHFYFRIKITNLCWPVGHMLIGLSRFDLFL